MTTEYRFLEPLDVLFLRGNKLFGDPGSFGESLVPPWPSVPAGALRSMLLANDGVDFSAFAAGDVEHPVLGTPRKPGSFNLVAFDLAGRDTRGNVLTFRAPPADVLISKRENGELLVQRLQPHALGNGIACSAPLPLLPVLPQKERSKAAGGYWLKQTGWMKYLAGETPTSNDLAAATELWQIDPRVGVGLDVQKRTATDGRLFSTQAVAMRKRGSDASSLDIGFLVGCTGAALPERAVVRLGGDGRGAALCKAAPELPKIDFDAIARARRCRLVLTTPGIFPDGWKLPGMDGDNVLHLSGMTARVTCAAVARAEVISGWDLAHNHPKSARRAAPTGSVYWLDDLDATPEALCTLMHDGLWTATSLDAQRRAEGFNRFTFAVY
jgi:CRISPR-associated protein Cmr3